MEMTDFVQKLKMTKTSYGSNLILKVRGSKCRRIQEIISVGKSKVPKQFAKTEDTKQVVVFFKEPEHLTEFQAKMLFSVWVKGVKPSDYGAYHKCIAGQRFIANIDEIRAVDKTVMEEIHKTSMLTEEERETYYRLQEKMNGGK